METLYVVFDRAGGREVRAFGVSRFMGSETPAGKRRKGVRLGQIGIEVISSSTHDDMSLHGTYIPNSGQPKRNQMSPMRFLARSRSWSRDPTAANAVKPTHCSTLLSRVPSSARKRF